MKLIVEHPVDEEDIKDFNDRLAKMKSFLLLEKIKKMNLSDKTKDEILKNVFNILESKPADELI